LKFEGENREMTESVKGKPGGYGTLMFGRYFWDISYFPEQMDFEARTYLESSLKQPTNL
jgi:hypothetical protein